MATTTPISKPDLLEAPGFVPGNSPEIRKINALIVEVAKTDIPILLVGESGSGKEVYARVVHRLSGRGDDEPLQKLNCSTRDAGKVLEALINELRPDGMRKQTNCGTVFLDGVHDLDTTEQRILLSLLPDGELGAYQGQQCPRILSSTTRNLEKEVAASRFLNEIYFRLCGVVLHLPPLRERKEDIPALMQYFLSKYANELNKGVPVLDSEAQELLGSHDWPGNIRELENMAKKIVAFGDPFLALGDLLRNREKTSKDNERSNVSPLKAASREASLQAEKALIQKALERTHWNRKRAARDLQISYKSLLYKIKQAGLDGNKMERE